MFIYFLRQVRSICSVTLETRKCLLTLSLTMQGNRAEATATTYTISRAPTMHLIVSVLAVVLCHA